MQLLIMGEISNENCGTAILHALNTKDKTIYIYIDSEGGDPDAALTLFYTLRSLKKRIITVVLNKCQSSGIIVALAGHERYALENATYTIHAVKYADAPGDLDTAILNNLQSSLAAGNRQFFQLICNNTKLTEQKIKKKIADSPKGDWDFNISVAKKYGLCTHVGFPVREESE